MYVPAPFALTADDTATALGRGGFAHLVTAGPGGLLTTSLPLLHDAVGRRLLGHVSRANPHWRDADGRESVALFTGVDGYVSPRWYPPEASRTRMAPTWNYEVVTVHGRLAIHDDVDWLRGHVLALTEAHERDREQPWSVDEVDAGDVEVMLRAIVGVELVIDRVEGKAKLSQNQPESTRAAVIDTLSGSGSPADRALAERMSVLESGNRAGGDGPRR